MLHLVNTSETPNVFGIITENNRYWEKILAQLGQMSLKRKIYVGV